MRSRLSRLLAGVALAALLLPWLAPAAAGVVAESTRVIFPADAAEQSLQLANLNDYPVVVQAWVDDGELASLPEHSTAPVIPLPPIFRLEAGAQTSLRLLHTRAPLARDRESLFWLNLYEIPPLPRDASADAATLTVALRTQMKIFMRPAALPMAPGAVAERLAFSLGADADADTANGAQALLIDNPTPYFASIGTLYFTGAPPEERTEGFMVPPHGRASLPLESPARAAGARCDAVEVVFTLIDDEGAAIAHRRAIGERRSGCRALRAPSLRVGRAPVVRPLQAVAVAVDRAQQPSAAAVQAELAP